MHVVTSAVEPTWTVKRRAPAPLLDSLDVGSPLLAQLLLNRGIASAAEAASFLDGEDRLGDPFTMAGMSQALDRIAGAVRVGERVVVYGDYDVDGLSGATLLARALSAVGARVEVFIPHRERDGYGLNQAVLDRLAAEGAGLVISVDCGIGAAAEIAAASRAGLEVIVTDHHQVPPVLPLAVAVLNPHRPDCSYPFKQLAGAGVALKLAQAATRRFLPGHQAGALEERLLELAALGTVADIMPLVGENRTIVRRGLRRLNTNPSPGLRALCRQAKVAPGWLDVEAVAFQIAPRLNAAGRVSDAVVAQRLLAAETDEEAAPLAEELESFNGRRRQLTDQALEQARAEVAALGPLTPAGIVVCGEYPAGVLGLLAARLAEETRRPVAAIGMGEALCRGSVRGVPGFNTVAAVQQCGDTLLQFGGHHGAAGLSMAPGQLDAFRTRFAAAVEPALAALPPAGPVEADCALWPGSINWGLCEVLARLEPCGEGNPPPLFETRGMLVRETRTVAERHQELKLVGEDGARLRAIVFDGAECGPPQGQLADLLYRVRRSLWNDAVCVELDVVAWRPSAA